MPWFYVDDGFSDSKPVMDMPDRYRLAACGLWVLSGSWSAKEETDGFVPDSKLRQLGSRASLVEVLTNSGSMSASLCDKVSGGIQFKSWQKWQKTREELIEKRREAAERQRNFRSGKNKGRNAVSRTDVDMSQRDSDVTNNVTDDERNAPVTRDPHARARRPDPTRPDPTRSSLLTSKGEGYVSSDPDTPRPECSEHEQNSDGPCIACRRRREWDEQHAAQAEANELARRRFAKAAAAKALKECTLCDEDGWLLGSDGTPVEPAVKCKAHQQEQAHA